MSINMISAGVIMVERAMTVHSTMELHGMIRMAGLAECMPSEIYVQFMVQKDRDGMMTGELLHRMPLAIRLWEETWMPLMHVVLAAVEILTQVTTPFYHIS